MAYETMLAKDDLDNFSLTNMSEEAYFVSSRISNNETLDILNVFTEISDEEPIFEILNPTNDTVYMTISMFRNITTPVICIIGIIANIFACAAFLSSGLRKTSCNVYLAARSASDTMFLLTLMIVWLDSVDIPIFHTNGLCQTVVFLSYISSFFSVWMVVAVSFENYIRLCHPTCLYLFCTVRKASLGICVLLFLSVSIYNFPLWITGLQHFRGKRFCMTNDAYKQMYLVMTYIDSLLTLIIPLSVILILCIGIICRAVEAYKRRVRLRKITALRTGSAVLFSLTPEAKITRLLFLVSVLFIVLHSPMHIMRTIMIIKLYIIKSGHLEPIEPSLKIAFETLYYLNFAINFLIYFTCGTTFRKIFCRIFCKCCAHRFFNYQPVMKTVGEQTELTFMNGIEETVPHDKQANRGSL